ncbi:MAG: aminotransferase class I/II-fold pyridoxal phosphate-dependent enzyme [Oligoflexia bacterium]|nr:aminotransferase class I/II-fold pyridoxal phosphate-dependent enzyme [Oligoflexia bacterium]
MKIPYLNLTIDKDEKSDLISEISNLMSKGRFVGGDEITSYEKALEKYLNTKNILGVASGNSSLYLALKTLNLKKDDEVIIPNISWVATAHAVEIAGGTCVFADVNDDLTIDCSSVERLVTDKTKAIICVHFMGIPCDIEKLVQISQKKNLKLIEDCSQAFGLKYGEKAVGTFGDFGCYSTNCMKILAGLGDSGFLISRNELDHKRIKPWLYNGVDENKQVVDIELCHRIDTIQAAILKFRLSKVDFIISQRKSNALKIIKETNNNKIAFIDSRERVYYGLTLMINEDRARLIDHLNKYDIEVKVEHEPCLSDLTPYKSHKSEFENAAKLSKSIVNIPISEALSTENIDHIIQSINSWNP